MGKDSPSPPPAPDPATTIKQQALALPSYEGPKGTSVYSGDPSAGTFKLTETLSPQEQAKYDEQQKIALAMLGAGGQRLPALTDPYQFTGAQDPTTNAVYNAGMELLTPTWDRQQRQLEQSLANKGLPMGSDAYKQELSDYQKNRSQAERQLAAQSIGQGFTQDLTSRQQNYAELAALLSGLGSQPSVTAGGGTGSANPLDVQSAQALYQQGLNTAYQGDIASSNQKNATTNAGIAAAATVAAAVI